MTTSSRSHPPLAYEDERFLESDGARPLRILAEYLAPLEAFRREQIQDTVVFFGSARLAPRRAARALLRGRAHARAPPYRVVGPASGARRFVVCSGGGGGIMEAANRGAPEAGGSSIGLNIGLPHEQRPNRYTTPGLRFEFRYFFMRKLWFAYLARALVVFPGGFGTLDELMEILTLRQTGKLARPIPILLYGPTYWNEIMDFDALVRHGMIAREDLELFTFADDPSSALALLQGWLRPEPEAATPAFAASRGPGPGTPGAPGE